MTESKTKAPPFTSPSFLNGCCYGAEKSCNSRSADSFLLFITHNRVLLVVGLAPPDPLRRGS